MADFPGALVLVTHDRYMLDRIATEILALDGKGAARSFASLSQWQAAQEEAEQARSAAGARPAVAPVAKPASAGPKRLTWSEQRELEQMEEKILAAEEDLHRQQKLMEDPEVLADHLRLRDVCTAVDAAQKRVQSFYERWQELESRKR